MRRGRLCRTGWGALCAPLPPVSIRHTPTPRSWCCATRTSTWCRPSRSGSLVGGWVGGWLLRLAGGRSSRRRVHAWSGGWSRCPAQPAEHRAALTRACLPRPTPPSTATSRTRSLPGGAPAGGHHHRPALRAVRVHARGAPPRLPGALLDACLNVCLMSVWWVGEEGACALCLGSAAGRPCLLPQLGSRAVSARSR